MFQHVTCISFMKGSHFCRSWFRTLWNFHETYFKGRPKLHSETADLVIFTGEILNRKFYFLCNEFFLLKFWIWLTSAVSIFHGSNKTVRDFTKRKIQRFVLHKLERKVNLIFSALKSKSKARGRVFEGNRVQKCIDIFTWFYFFPKKVKIKNY